MYKKRVNLKEVLSFMENSYCYNPNINRIDGFMRKELEAIYTYNNKEIATDIEIDGYEINLFDFNRKIYISSAGNKAVLHYDYCEVIDLELILIMYDRLFLEHLIVNFEDLPKYMQYNWNKYCEDSQYDCFKCLKKKKH